MATASELDKIRCNPIKERLATFRRRFESTRSGLDVPSSSNVVQTVFSTAATAVAKSLVLDLIQALQIEPAARTLPSRIADRTVSGDLAILYGRVDANQLDIASAIPLVEQIVKNEPDEPTWNDSDIWHAVLELVARTNPATPPTAFEKAVLDTPLRSSSASQSGIEQTHDEIDQRIREELTGRVYDDVEDFHGRYFEGKTWTHKAKNIYEQSRTQYAKGRWVGWPEPSLQSSFFDWFMKFQDTVLSGLGRQYYTSANKVLRGSEANRKLDIFLTLADVAILNEGHDWSNVLVIGEHKQNPDEDRSTKTLVQLAGYAREVFGSQPDRRFVPGFTICGSVMRLWVFDRSGPYSSEKFDINKEPERFIQVIAGYALMTEAELGLNTFIRRDGDKYIVAQGVRIWLEDKPLAWQRAIVCRGTACYRGRNKDPGRWDHVVKFAWPSDKRYREGDLLKLAKERGVKGIAEWVHHEQINIDGHPDTISHLRRGMKFGVPRKLSSKTSWVDSGAGSSQGVSITRSLRGRSRSSKGRLTGLGISTSSTTISSSGQKRKRGGFVDGNGGMKRSKSGDSRTDLDIATDAENGDPDTADLRSIQEPEPDSLAGCESETYGNRIHCCLVVSPAGRPLHAYRSTKELLEALRDAVRGHKSLLEDGKILHRDISENNIIITEAASKGEPTGRLIDLDLAKELDSVPSGASHRTGTMQFMAIEVLQGKGHTYRHDLESFFYVLYGCAFVMVMLTWTKGRLGRSQGRWQQVLFGIGILEIIGKLPTRN
ncbi:hypothetical protein VC83_03925 [Pseudogymnoascus destructans]|uniref:EKC/KEOPS complex subunit BUD32 n=1 Tax=Pseudogymnoascus destructans TaxID=655981 RepID=A0A177AEV5_9PEZI|nr:uncharacterized protein VC83_03925 [Pseudogymnoascus destructans]OAF59713.1 hypothetical protein VC83_03925 [Pseudogymnoascus destructans]